MASYTRSEIKIDGNYPVIELLELSMDIGVNRHGVLTYGGLVAGEDALRYIRQKAADQVVRVSLGGKPEFCGYLREITSDWPNNDPHNNNCYLRVTLTTGSSLMDIYPRNRFYQDTRHSYADIIEEAYEDSGLGTLVAIRGEREIMRPILQRRETDWQFTLRMAGRLSTVVIPDPVNPDPHLALGVPKREVVEETNTAKYTISRSPDRFRRRFAVDWEIGYQDFLRYRITSKNRYRLGDSVKFDGKVFTVMEKSFAYEKGTIEEVYTLGLEDESAVLLYHNKNITGLELEGKVLDRQGQEMIVLLDIDAEREAREEEKQKHLDSGAKRKTRNKFWYSYAPVTNNAMYSMPLKGEKVMLQWQSELDHNVLIVRPVRKNSETMPDADERHFLTEQDNHHRRLKKLQGQGLRPSQKRSLLRVNEHFGSVA